MNQHRPPSSAVGPPNTYQSPQQKGGSFIALCVALLCLWCGDARRARRPPAVCRRPRASSCTPCRRRRHAPAGRRHRPLPAAGAAPIVHFPFVAIANHTPPAVVVLTPRRPAPRPRRAVASLWHPYAMPAVVGYTNWADVRCNAVPIGGERDPAPTHTHTHAHPSRAAAGSLARSLARSRAPPPHPSGAV